MRGRSVPRQFGQVLTRFWVEEAGADHAMSRIAAKLIRKRFFRVPVESEYTCAVERSAGDHKRIGVRGLKLELALKGHSQPGQIGTDAPDLGREVGRPQVSGHH